jgi:hypothetical protein
VEERRKEGRVRVMSGKRMREGKREGGKGRRKKGRRKGRTKGRKEDPLTVVASPFTVVTYEVVEDFSSPSSPPNPNVWPGNLVRSCPLPLLLLLLPVSCWVGLGLGFGLGLGEFGEVGVRVGGDAPLQL